MSLTYILKKISSPIIEQLPFFIVSVGLLGLEALQNIHGSLVIHDLITFQDLLSRFFATFFIAYLITTIVSHVKKTWFKVLVYSFLIIVWATNLYLRENFGLHISPSILTILAETTRQESKEFFNSFILTSNGLWIIIQIIIICITSLVFELAYHYWVKKHKKFLFNRGISFISSIIIFCFLFYGLFSFGKCFTFLMKCNNTDDFIHIDSYNWFPNDPVSQLLFSLYGVHIMNKEQKAAELLMQKLVDTQIITNNSDSLNIIVVIGESYIKAHSQLYGYKLKTTPNLQRERDHGNLFVFNDVVTPFNITTLAMKNALCTNCIADGESWSTKPFFPAIFKMAGYDVFMWDNQKTWGEGTNFVLSLNSFLYGGAVNDSYSKVNDEIFAYDEGIVRDFEKVTMSKKQNLIIFHLMGQHVDVEERYPHTKQFNHFTADSIFRHESYMTDEKRTLIANYDNATLYNDYVMNLIFDRFRNSNTLLVYFSDHGDEIYDYRDSKGRVKDGMSPLSVKYQYEVPFIIWCSNIFKNKNPHIVKELHSSVYRPFMTDNLCQLLFHIAGIETEYYRPKYDLIHKDFKPSTRLLEHTFDYDSIMTMY